MRFGITLLSEKLKWAPFSAGDEMGTDLHFSLQTCGDWNKTNFIYFYIVWTGGKIRPLRPSYVYPHHTPWQNETWLAESTIFVCYISPRVKTLRFSPPTFSVAGADLAFQGQARTQCSSVCGGASGHGTLERSMVDVDAVERGLWTFARQKFMDLDLRTPKNFCLFHLFPTIVCDRSKKVGCDLVLVQTAASAFLMGKRG